MGVWVGEGEVVVAVTGMGVAVLSGEGEVLIASVSTTSIVVVEAPGEHETKQTLNIPIHNHFNIPCVFEKESRGHTILLLVAV